MRPMWVDAHVPKHLQWFTRPFMADDHNLGFSGSPVALAVHPLVQELDSLVS